MEDPKPGPHRGFASAERIPDQPEPRRKVLQRRIVVPRIANGQRAVGDVAEVRDLAIDLRGHAHGLVAQPEIRGQPVRQPHVVLHEARDQPLAIPPIRIDLTGHRKVDIRGSAREEQFEIVERDDATGLAGGVLVELQVLRLRADPEQVLAPRPDQRVADLPVVEPIVARQAEVSCHLRHEPLNRQIPELLAWQPREVGRNVDRPLVVRQRHRSIEPHP